MHRKRGIVDWPNPNLDVAYSETWVAVDESSCAVVTETCHLSRSLSACQRVALLKIAADDNILKALPSRPFKRGHCILRT